MGEPAAPHLVSSRREPAVAVLVVVVVVVVLVVGKAPPILLCLRHLSRRARAPLGFSVSCHQKKSGSVPTHDLHLDRVGRGRFAQQQGGRLRHQARLLVRFRLERGIVKVRRQLLDFDLRAFPRVDRILGQCVGASAGTIVVVVVVVVIAAHEMMMVAAHKDAGIDKLFDVNYIVSTVRVGVEEICARRKKRKNGGGLEQIK